MRSTASSATTASSPRWATGVPGAPTGPTSSPTTHSDTATKLSRLSCTFGVQGLIGRLYFWGTELSILSVLLGCRAF